MLCCTLYSAFRVLSLNLILTAVNFLLFFIGFGSNQWATYETGTSCQAYTFIGLFEAKYGDCNAYDVTDVSCNDLGLNDSECTTFENSVGYAQGAAACAVMTLLFKILLIYISYQNTRNRILWLLMVVAFGADVIYGILCFMAVGEYQSVMEEFPIAAGEDYSVGYGWGLVLLGGLLAWICALLDGVVVVKGTGENSAVKEVVNDKK